MSKTAFVFPGQGSQNVGMGKDLYDNYKEAKEIYEKACEILDIDLIKLCFEGPIEELTKTEIAQPAILTTSIAAHTLLEKNGITPDMTAGHSLGEYSAYVAAEYLSFEDGLKAVRERGLAMAGADPDNKGSMAAIIGLDADVVEEICKEASKQGVVVAANFNTPNQIVVSGEKQGILKAIELAEEKEATLAKELVVSGAFHSPLMEGALDKFRNAIDTLDIKKGKCPVITNVSASPVDVSEIKDSLIRQMTSSVRWVASINKMVEMGAIDFIETGSGKILRGLIKKINRKLNVLSAGDSSSLEKALEKLK